MGSSSGLSGCISGSSSRFTTTKERYEELSLQPKTSYNGVLYPFGQYSSDDGEFHLIHKTVSKTGDDVHAIYGVRIGEYLYKIFIGECPTKNDEGVWTTTENVPTFVLPSFDGCKILDNEPDVPHIIRLWSDEDKTKRENEQVEENGKWYNALYNAEAKLVYCSLRTYLGGLNKRFKRNRKRLLGSIHTFEDKNIHIKSVVYEAPHSWKIKRIHCMRNSMNDEFILVDYRNKKDIDMKFYIIFKDRGKLKLKIRKERADDCPCGGG